MEKIKRMALLDYDGKLSKKKIALIILSLLALLVFVNERLSIVIGPVMALIMCYLFFSDYSEYVVALIIVANDALGTVFLGSVSFPYLLFVLVILKFGMNKKIQSSSFPFLLISAILIGELLFVEFISLKDLVHSLVFVLSLATLGKDPQKINNLLRGIALAVFLIALHACLTGGVEFYEHNIHSNEYIRKGVLGVGIGDSNYSCFLLNIGLVCIWCEKKLGVLIKFIATLPFLYALTITLSTSGLISILVMIALGILLGKNKPKAVVVLLVVCLILVSTFQIYINLPTESRIPDIDAYIERMIGKIDAFNDGDMTSVTTNRSDLATVYWEYILSQPLGKALFGGNTLIIADELAPHNTYIGVILQIGFLGAAVLLIFALKKIIMAHSRMKKENLWFKKVLLLKILCLFVATNLSLYSDNLWAFWMYFLFAV